MPIIGIGTDIIEVSRIRRLYQKHGKQFTERILHPNEQSILQQRTVAEPFLAKRFAAKEALAKALGTGIAKGIAFNEIEVFNNADGKPNLRLHGKAHAVAQQQGVKSLFISLSDEKDYAIAYVIVAGD